MFLGRGLIAILPTGFGNSLIFQLFPRLINALQRNAVSKIIVVTPPGGVLRISSDGDDRRIFLGLGFLIPGFFWVGKFGKNFFGSLDLSRDFFGYSKQSEDSCRVVPA